MTHRDSPTSSPVGGFLQTFIIEIQHRFHWKSASDTSAHNCAIIFRLAVESSLSRRPWRDFSNGVLFPASGRPCLVPKFPSFPWLLLKSHFIPRIYLRTEPWPALRFQENGFAFGENARAIHFYPRRPCRFAILLSVIPYTTSSGDRSTGNEIFTSGERK